MRTLAACLFTVLTACGGTDNAGDGDGDRDPGVDAGITGECVVDTDCGTGKKCVAGGVCVVGGCGQSTLNLDYIAPNLLFVVDRSCSMRNAPSGTTASKWNVAVDGINQVITSHGADIRYGLTLFPDIAGESCTQQSFAFPLADGNGAGIQTLLTTAKSTADALYPDGPCVTNIDTGLQQAATDPGLADPSRKSYVMLVTDGAQSSCNAAGGDAGSEQIVANLAASGVKTFVIGFGSAVDVAQLNKMAVAGSTALAGTTKYYKAETPGELDAALQTIADQVISCEYRIDPAPPVLDLTYVWFEKTSQVPRDTTHSSGWDFDTTTNTLTLYGSYCQQLQTRQVDEVDVVYDCSGPLL